MPLDLQDSCYVIAHTRDFPIEFVWIAAEGPLVQGHPWPMHPAFSAQSQATPKEQRFDGWMAIILHTHHLQSGEELEVKIMRYMATQPSFAGEGPGPYQSHPGHEFPDLFP